MAYPTAVNGQITDAVTQQNISVLASAPAMAMGVIYQSAAHSLGILYQNATAAQHQAAICAQAATNQGVMQLYSVNSMAAALATRKVARASPTRDLVNILILREVARRL
jgi:hypothetical protein